MALTPIHPGEHLAEELEALGMSASELARRIKVPANRVTEILNGDRSVTGDTAPCVNDAQAEISSHRAAAGELSPTRLSSSA